MSERRSSTICAVVKRPDYHCGDDLVFFLFVPQAPGSGDIKVSVVSIPESVIVGSTFDIQLKVTNCSLVQIRLDF